MLRTKHGVILNNLTKGEESWDAAIPDTYGTFLGRPLRLRMYTYVMDISYIQDPSPPPTERELLLAERVLDHLPALLEEAQRSFVHYNTEMTDDPDAMAKVVRPTVHIDRDDVAGKTDERWRISVSRDDIPLGYGIEFDGLRYLEVWAAS